jgi:hypothetical protein
MSVDQPVTAAALHAACMSGHSHSGEGDVECMLIKWIRTPMPHAISIAARLTGQFPSAHGAPLPKATYPTLIVLSSTTRITLSSTTTLPHRLVRQYRTILPSGHMPERTLGTRRATATPPHQGTDPPHHCSPEWVRRLRQARELAKPKDHAAPEGVRRWHALHPRDDHPIRLARITPLRCRGVR